MCYIPTQLYNLQMNLFDPTWQVSSLQNTDRGFLCFLMHCYLKFAITFRVRKFWGISTSKMRLAVLIVRSPKLLQPTLQTIRWKFTSTGEAKAPQQYPTVACTVHWSQPYRWHKVSASHTAYLLPMFRLDSFLFFLKKGEPFQNHIFLIICFGYLLIWHGYSTQLAPPWSLYCSCDCHCDCCDMFGYHTSDSFLFQSLFKEEHERKRWVRLLIVSHHRFHYTWYSIWYDTHPKLFFFFLVEHASYYYYFL